MTQKSKSEVLRDAAAHIERVGLHKSNYFKLPPGLRLHSTDPIYRTLPCCVAGALAITTGEYGFEIAISRPSYLDLWDELDQHVPVPFTELSEWNDDPDTTQEDVTAFLRAQADRYAAAGD